MREEKSPAPEQRADSAELQCLLLFIKRAASRPDSVPSLVQSGAVEKLVEMLDSPDSALQINALWGLTHLAANSVQAVAAMQNPVTIRKLMSLFAVPNSTTQEYVSFSRHMLGVMDPRQYSRQQQRGTGPAAFHEAGTRDHAAVVVRMSGRAAAGGLLGHSDSLQGHASACLLVRKVAMP